jgi:ABC-2 type transport system permease protein
MSAVAVALRPSFAGTVRGEVLKLSRQLSFWLTLGGAVFFLALIVVAITGGQNIKSLLLSDPTAWAYDKLEVFGTLFQIGSGIFLLIFGSRLISMEYSSGTIRILYARGTSRLQLLAAQLVTIAIIGAVLLAGYLVLVGAILAVMISALAGSLDSVQHISAQFWQDVEWWLLVQGISIGMAMLIAAAASGIGRSLAFGISAALVFYPVDNFLNILEILGIRATGHDQPWTAFSQYQLSPNLNVLLTLLEPDHRSRSAFSSPLAAVSSGHALAVIGVFALVFAAIAIIRTTRPDVLE